MYATLRKAYESAPDFARIPIGWCPFRFIAGEAYRRTMDRGRQFERAVRDDILAFQELALGQMLRFACDQVPAYRSLRSTVERLPALEAIKAFPFIDKATIQEDPKRFLPRDFALIKHYEVTTGGTSGNQLLLYMDDDSHAEETAFMHRQWQRVGYTTRCRKATFRGVEFPRADCGKFWQINPIYNEIQFSPCHMNEHTMGEFIERMRGWRPRYLHGYPSAIALLAQYVISNQISLEPLRIRAALLCSEPLLSGQRETIEKAFSTRVFSWYGHSERLILAGECEKTNVYHHFPDYGLLEIIDDDGNVLDEEGATGELVGTTFWNNSQPLIRYRTEDRARKLANQCECGRCYDRFDRVEGRWKQEYLIGVNGSKISAAAMNMHGTMFDNVVRYQYYQNTPGIIELRLMTRPDFEQKDIAILQEAYRKKVGDELQIVFNPVDDIPLTSRGKFRRLIQDIPKENMNN